MISICAIHELLGAGGRGSGQCLSEYVIVIIPSISRFMATLPWSAFKYYPNLLVISIDNISRVGKVSLLNSSPLLHQHVGDQLHCPKTIVLH